MSKRVTLTLDDETGAYLARIAADQGQTAAELAAWIVTEDLRREQHIDAELVARLDATPPSAPNSPVAHNATAADLARRERPGA